MMLRDCVQGTMVQGTLITSETMLIIKKFEGNMKSTENEAVNSYRKFCDLSQERRKKSRSKCYSKHCAELHMLDVIT